MRIKSLVLGLMAIVLAASNVNAEEVLIFHQTKVDHEYKNYLVSKKLIFQGQHTKTYRVVTRTEHMTGQQETGEAIVICNPYHPTVRDTELKIGVWYNYELPMHMLYWRVCHNINFLEYEQNYEALGKKYGYRITRE